MRWTEYAKREHITGIDIATCALAATVLLALAMMGN